ncbi:MAG: response regulator [Nitrososphaera sp.]|nr:response regulator [Nitrososphaera sp.]MCI0708012.1 response regulator [Ignavibacteriota bacterium]
MTVLLVDDEDSFRLVMREVLSALPEFRVLDCDSGEAAIEMLKQEAIDLVVLDYKMPRLTGLNVLQWINEQKMDVPVVMLTAAGTETVAVEAMKLGAYDYMRKEHIDVTHTPIILKGVYERYLFRQEREQREHLEKERTASVVAIEAFHDTLATLAQIANTTLSILSANIDTCEKELKKHPMSEDKQSELVVRISEMKQNFSVIASSVKSMFSIANLLHGNFGDAQYATQIREQIKDKLRTVDVQKVEVTTDKSKN